MRPAGGGGSGTFATSKLRRKFVPVSRKSHLYRQVEGVADLLNAMDIFVLPTLMEGMSNTLLEALAVGLPAIATRVGGNPEVLAGGSCGFLFAPQDVAELVSQLRTLLRDSQLRADFGKAARERALQNFSLQQMLGRYRDLYIDLAMRRSATLASTAYVRN